MNIIILSFLIFFLNNGVSGYPDGAPKAACLDMTPQHGQGFRPPGPSYHDFVIHKTPPYKFTLGEKISFSLNVQAQHANFKGFLIQVHSV